MLRLRLICRWVSPFADSRSTSRILRTDNLSAAIPTPGRSPQERVASGVKVSSAAAASPSGQLRPKRVVSLLRNGWSDSTEIRTQPPGAERCPGKQVVTAWARRQVVGKLRAAYHISERRALRFTGFARSSVRYRSVREPQDALRAAIREIAGEKPRWGYRFIHDRLRERGWIVNRKRVQRLYRLENLAVRRRGKRKRSQIPRLVRPELERANQRWSMDFMSDALASGRRFRCLNIIDEFTRECLAIEVSHSLPAVRVIEVLERLRSERGLPDVIVTDNGTEFTSRAFDAWAYARGVKIDFIQPGKPVQNCFVESFNGTFRDDCLNLHWFTSLAAAKVQIECWRREYNTERPHSSLKRLTPARFAELHQSGGLESAPITNPAVR